MIRCFTLVMMTALILGCGAETPATVATTLTDDDYKLYSAILRDEMDTATKQFVVLSASCVTCEGGVLDGMKVRAAHRSLMSALQNSPTTTTLTPRFDADLKIAVVPKKEIEALSKDDSVGDFWTQFNKKYPNSQLVRFSMPAWNQERTAAMVYASISWGGLAGHGDLYALAKSKLNGRWKVQKVYPMWIS